MNKFLPALKSRTFWTLVVMVAFNTLPNLPVDQSVKDLVNGILGLLAAYFHVNPSQVYSPAGSTITQTAPTTVTVTNLPPGSPIPPVNPPA